jgi:ABC-type glycerol-3-phosphate transport system substrate-binding protein
MCTGLDGKLYALPYVYDCYQMVWNKKIFEEYGITDAPDTWDKVYNYGKKITELAKGKVWGVAFEGRYFQWDLIPWARTFGVPGHLWDPTTHKPLLNHPATIEALEWAVKLMEVAPPGVISYGDYDCAKSYMAGEVAMAFVWTRAEIEDPSKSLAAGVTEYSPIPKKVSYASYGSGHNFMLNKYGKNKDAAYKLIEFLLKPTIQLKYMKYKGPTVKQGLKPEYLKAYPYLKGFEATLPYVTFDPRIPEIREVYDIMGKWVSKALLKEIDAKTACDNMQAEVEKLLAKYVR